MKLHWFTILCALLIWNFAAMGADMLSTEQERISYGIGMQIGRNITNNQLEINLDSLYAGIKTVVNGTKPLLTDEQLREAMTSLQTKMQAKQAERMKQMETQRQEAALKTKKEGDAFLAANKQKEGIITTPSGLQYKVAVMGTGPKPTSNDTVIVHYRGTLLDNTEFDSSYKQGEPKEFAVKGVIKGWTEALQMMPVGSKWQLFIPSELAYGQAGMPRGRIAPNSVLQFDLELIGIKAPDAKSEKDKEKTAITPATAPAKK